MTRIALVAGAGGIIGKALLEEIAARPDWRALALSRKGGDVSADLTDRDATRVAIEGAKDVTQLFYAAYKPGGGLAEEDRVNSSMLRNLLDGLKAVGAPIERVVLYQGAKVYGGPSRTRDVAVLRRRQPAPARTELLLQPGGRVAAPG